MLSRSRAVAPAVILALVSVNAPSGSAQAPQDAERPAQERPVFRGGINVVRVDAIVTDRDGRPVLDLTERDFGIFEDGRPQRIESFKLVQVPSTLSPDREAPVEIRPGNEDVEASRDDTRLVAILLDDYHVRAENSIKVRAPLSEFLSARLAPADMVAVMYPLMSLDEIAFTRDHAAVARAVSRFRGRKYEYRPENVVEQRYAQYPPRVIERVRHQVTMTALKALAARLGSLREGRKTIVLVSEGFTAFVPAEVAVPGIENARPETQEALVGPTGDPRMQELEIAQDLREVADLANRHNTSIYTLDPRGLAVQEFDIGVGSVGPGMDRDILRQTIDTLRTIAESTDGRAIVSQNDLAKGLAQILTDSSAYYLMSYSSADAPQDGKFHKIEVKVSRPRVGVRARPGYWALTAAAAARALTPPKPGPAPAVEAALATLAAVVRGRIIRTWVGMAPAQNGQTRVTFVWEPTPASSGRRDDPVLVRLTAAGGEGRPYFRGPVPADTGGRGPAAGSLRGGAAVVTPRGPGVVTFEASPGSAQLALTVEGPGSEILDRDSQEIVVPDFTGPEVSLGTPQIFRARTVREWQTFAADAQAVPAIARDFSRRERLLVRFGVYGPGGSDPAARLLNREGQAIGDLEVHPSRVGPQLHQVDVPLSGLAAGEYLIELAAGEATDLVAIRVSG